jgi:hypothetical protein
MPATKKLLADYARTMSEIDKLMVLLTQLQKKREELEAAILGFERQPMKTLDWVRSKGGTATIGEAADYYGIDNIHAFQRLYYLAKTPRSEAAEENQTEAEAAAEEARAGGRVNVAAQAAGGIEQRRSGRQQATRLGGRT